MTLRQALQLAEAALLAKYRAEGNEDYCKAANILAALRKAIGV